MINDYDSYIQLCKTKNNRYEILIIGLQPTKTRAELNWTRPRVDGFKYL